jgi:hypothetical protein
MKRLVTALVLLAALAGAETLSVSLGQIACIQSEGYGRLLTQFDLSAIPESSYVYYAEIVAPCAIAETVAIETRRITTPWSRMTVQWNYPWRKSGGDYDTTKSAMFVYIAGRHNGLALDVTEQVRDWLRYGHSRNYGLLFRKGITREPGFKKVQGLTSVLANARVRVIFRRTLARDEGKGSTGTRD